MPSFSEAAADLLRKCRLYEFRDAIAEAGVEEASDSGLILETDQRLVNRVGIDPRRVRAGVVELYSNCGVGKQMDGGVPNLGCHSDPRRPIGH